MGRVYLHHVDHVRALSILLVLGYHLDTPLFGKGYVGVDMFFVLSGFLITRNLLMELDESGKIQLWTFYRGRICRLFPALLTTLTGVILVSPCLSAVSRTQLGNSLTAATLSLSNLYFYQTAGYFSTASAFKPLLHTWSLSVEEQFYLLWPVLLLLNRKRVGVMVAVFFSLNVLFNEHTARYSFHTKLDEGMFFLPQYRAYEFLIGAGLANHMNGVEVKNNFWLAMVSLNIGLLAIFSVLFDDLSLLNFVSAERFIACAGTAMLILGGCYSSWQTIPFASKASRTLSESSYSIYLVHWPFIALTRVFRFSIHLSAFDKLGLLFASVSTGCMITRYVESPCRSYEKSSKNSSRALLYVAMMMFFCATGLILRSSLWEQLFLKRSANNRRHVTPDMIDLNTRRRGLASREICVASAPNCPKEPATFVIIVIGNSHELDAARSFTDMYGRNRNVSVVQYGGTNGCFVPTKFPFAIERTKYSKSCLKRAEHLHSTDFAKKVGAVVLSSLTRVRNDGIPPFGWTEISAALKQLLARYYGINPNVVFITMSMYAELKMPFNEIEQHFGDRKATMWPENMFTSPFSSWANVTNISLPIGAKGVYVEKRRLFCYGSTSSSCKYEVKGEPFTYDRDHLSSAFTVYQSQRIAQVYGKELLDVGMPPFSP